MRWHNGNWPDFTANKLHVTCGYEAKSKILGAPKTDHSMRDVDMPPTVRAVLETLPTRGAGGIVFPRPDGRMFSRSAMDDAWQQTIKTTKVRRILPYDLRHAFASLLIAAGKNPLYIARQMGHHTARFTLDTYGHVMESLPRRQVEWIDEIVFAEGYEAALISESAAPVNASVFDFLRRPAEHNWALFPATRQSRVAPRAEGPALDGRGAGDMVS